MTHLCDLVVHNKLVDTTFDRLRSSGRYDSLQKYVEYHACKQHGECDILASNDKFINYYEMKCSNHPHAFERALAQFKRFKATHPMLHARFIYVTPKVTKRIYL